MTDSMNVATGVGASMRGPASQRPLQWQMWAWVWSDLREVWGLTANDKAVLSVLIGHWNNKKGGYVYPSHKRLAALSGVSKSTVTRCLKTLERRCLIERTRLPGYYNTRYTITIPTELLPGRHTRFARG